MLELYGKDSKGGLKYWAVFTRGDEIHVKHGKVGGKIQTKVTKATAKNIGKSNETTPEQQADIEAEAKWVKQKKSGYFETQEEALNFQEFTPMKCQDYKHYPHKVVYPGYVQPKLNGIRVMIDRDGQAWSKAGEPYSLPKHLQDGINKLALNNAIPLGLDCEAYAGLESEGGLSLQQIVSAFRKPNENTDKLQLWIYDIPASNVGFELRTRLMDSLSTDIINLDLEYLFKVVDTSYVYTKEIYDSVHDNYVKAGYEGSVWRNVYGQYEFGKRSYDVIKRKPRQETEARVVSVEEDKNQQGVLLCELENGVQVECLMLKEADPDVNYRLCVNAEKLIGSFITVEFEEYSDAGIPTKPVGIKLRNVRVDNGKWVVLE